MAKFIDNNGGYYTKGDDLDHVWTVIRTTDANGVEHTDEYVTSYACFLAWHAKAKSVIEEIERKRAEAVILTLPKGRRVAKG